VTRVIRGAGGGGKGGGQQQGRTPTEASDSLRSKAYARVVDLLSEGEIEGLVDGARSIYLNDTPLQNRDGSYNFQGAVWVERRGTQSQAYVPGFDAVESSTSVGTEVLENTPITRAFTNPNINAIGVTIGIPQLSFQDEETGDVGGESVRLRIDLQTGGGVGQRQHSPGLWRDAAAGAVVGALRVPRHQPGRPCHALAGRHLRCRQHHHQDLGQGQQPVPADLCRARHRLRSVGRARGSAQ